MEIYEDKILLEIDFDGEEVTREIAFAMKRLSWFERVFKNPQRLVINFTISFLFFFLIGWKTEISVFLSAVSAFVLSSLAPSISFQLFSKITIYLENLSRKENGYKVTLFYKYQLDESGIKQTGENVNTETNWSEIIEAFETENDFVVFYKPTVCFLFPKRVFSTFDEMIIFKNFIERKIGDKAKF